MADTKHRLRKHATKKPCRLQAGQKTGPKQARNGSKTSKNTDQEEANKTKQTRHRNHKGEANRRAKSRKKNKQTIRAENHHKELANNWP